MAGQLKCKLFGAILSKKSAFLATVLLLVTLLGCSSMSENSPVKGGDNALFRAIDHQNVELVKELIPESDLNNTVGQDGSSTNSSLLLAMSANWDSRANRGPTDVFKILLEAGANVNERLTGGDTPCFYAVALSDEAGIRYMELMLEHGADLSLQNNEGNTVLDEAVKCGKDKTALYLIKRGAMPTENTIRMLFDGYTDSRDGRCAYAMLHSLVANYGLISHEIPSAIQTAVMGGKPSPDEIAELSEENLTWLRCCAAAFGSKETLETLCEAVNYNEVFDAEGQSLLEIAAQTGNRETLTYLLKEKNCEPFLWRSLVHAVESYQTECAADLLEHVNSKHLQELSRQEWEMEWLWRKALIHDDAELLALLYEHGFIPIESNSIDNCIRDSIEEGKAESLVFLLDSFNVTPGDYLVTACRYQNVEAAQMLIMRGVTKSDADYALPHAAASGSVEIVQLLLELGADPNVQEPTYGSPLLAAAKYGYLEVVELLLNRGADTRQKYWDEGDNILIEVAFGSNRILRSLINAGAEVNYQNTEGRTPLHYAVINNRPENVALLLDAGADPMIVDAQGNSPLDIARQEGFGKVESLFEDKGTAFLS